MVAFNLDVPEPTFVKSEKQAKKLLSLAMKKIEVDPGDFIAYDTETHALKIPLKTKKDGNPTKNNPLDWMRDTVTFWSLSFKHEQYDRWCLQGQHLYLFTELLENPAANIVTWNGKYDAHVTWNSGLNVWNSNYMDCLVMASLVDENLQGSLDLKSSAARKEGFFGRDQALLHKLESGELSPWDPIRMTKFKDLFGTKDEKGRKIEEFTTSLFDLPVDKVSNYASLDAYATLRLAEHLHEILNQIPITDDYSMWDHYLTMEVPITEVLWRMERRGLGLDRKYLKSLIAPIDKELKHIEEEINRRAGWFVDIKKTADLRNLFFGPKPQGLGLEPVKMTKGGTKLPVPSTDDMVLEIISLHYTGKSQKLATLIRRHRSVAKTRSTYVNALLKLAKWHADHRIHPSFNQFGARTGRFSTTNPNSQNFPRPDTDEFKIRRAFVARRGCKLIVVDYEQLEMRIMAHMSKDKGMLEAIRNGLDLHCVTVEKMYGIPYEEVKAAKKTGNIDDKNPLTQEKLSALVALDDKCPCELSEMARLVMEEGAAPDDLIARIALLLRLRQECKTIGFAIIYGAGAARISQQLECSKEEAQEKIDSYFRAFPGVQKFMKTTVDECRFEEFVTTIVGRRRRLPDINSHQFTKYSHAEREAVNAIIQGTASDMAKAAMILIEFDEELNALGYQLLNQIHDEIVGEAPEENAEAALKIIKHHMEFPFDGEPALEIDTPADGKIVDSWDRAK
jgi:DNA polymerase I